MNESIWLRNQQRDSQPHPTSGVQFYADAFVIVPSEVTRTREEIAAMAEKDYGPPVDPRMEGERWATSRQRRHSTPASRQTSLGSTTTGKTLTQTATFQSRV